MVVERSFRYIGRGLYTASEAASLTDIPRQRITRWTQGYTYRYKGDKRYTPPAIASQLGRIDGNVVIDFADLIEVRFLDAFRQAGVGWKAIRIASQEAKSLLGRHHPFSTRIFKTDGRTILADIVRTTGDRMLLDLVRNQFEFEKVVTPFLYFGIDFSDLEEPIRWWPLGTNRMIVIDPERCLGAPIVAAEGVPTRILYQALSAHESVSMVAAMYEVTETAVLDAVEFERQRIA